ncbi:Protein of unknown function DUF1800 [uncultured Caudovirales phage]|uniref:DUF1800 family protein n=1 Tax=uncultured Caudovirales phage TaxID=2100421 RepID=A0A6J5M749_9CAUD|nr:Protein of unknown function DUF1800 [uncultured Caudovirales phage]
MLILNNGRRRASLGGGTYNPVYNPLYDVSPEGPSDLRRFLTQATMGPTVADVDGFSGTFGTWINNQLALPAEMALSTNSAVDFSTGNAFAEDSGREIMRQSILSTAQLKMRVAQVLSQLIVCGYSAAMRTIDAKAYWNGMLNAANGNFRDVLEVASVQVWQGYYLNNINNTARNGLFPNQNFMRELLQLFSLGQEALAKDGSRTFNTNGSIARAYSQPDINAGARLMCGWGEPVNASTSTNRNMAPRPDVAYNGPALSFFGFTEAQYPVFGPQGQTVGSATVNGYTPTAQNIIDRKNAVLDIIMLQPSVAPFVCRHMITRLVTDNPTPQYIRRVVAAFENNGSGVRGSMPAVIRAILLDPEARGNSKPVAFGRVIEPSLMQARMFRYAQQASFAVFDPAIVFNGAWQWQQVQGGARGIMRKTGDWTSQPQTVFSNFPSSFEAAPGIKSPASSLRNSAGISTWLGDGMSGLQFNAGDDVNANNAWGRWLCTSLVALHNATAGTAAQKNAAVVARMLADLMPGQTPSAPVISELESYGIWLDGQVAGNLRLKYVHLLGAMSVVNEFWRQQ